MWHIDLHHQFQRILESLVTDNQNKLKYAQEGSFRKSVRFQTILIVFSVIIALQGVNCNCFPRCKYLLYLESKQHLIRTHNSSFNLQNDTNFFSTFKFIFCCPCRNIRNNPQGKKVCVVQDVQCNYAISLIS